MANGHMNRANYRALKQTNSEPLSADILSKWFAGPLGKHSIPVRPVLVVVAARWNSIPAPSDKRDKPNRKSTPILSALQTLETGVRTAATSTNVENNREVRQWLLSLRELLSQWPISTIAEVVFDEWTPPTAPRQPWHPVSLVIARDTFTIWKSLDLGVFSLVAQSRFVGLVYSVLTRRGFVDASSKAPTRAALAAWLGRHHDRVESINPSLGRSIQNATGRNLEEWRLFSMDLAAQGKTWDDWR